MGRREKLSILWLFSSAVRTANRQTVFRASNFGFELQRAFKSFPSRKHFSLFTLPDHRHRDFLLARFSTDKTRDLAAAFLFGKVIGICESASDTLPCVTNCDFHLGLIDDFFAFFSFLLFCVVVMLSLLTKMAKKG
jgi:hypothetical protein